MLSRPRPFASLLALLLCAAAPAMAAPGAPILGVQLLLRTLAGGPVPDGDYGMSVQIHDAATGGTPLAEKLFIAVPVQGGFASVELFDDLKTPLPDKVFNGEARWLGVTVGAGPELPRVRLHDVPQAVWARAAKVAASLQCSACVDGSMLAAGAVLAQHVAFAYAGSESKGGAAWSAKSADSAKVADFAATTDEAKLALGLQCSGCVKATAVAPTFAADLVSTKQLASVAVSGQFADLAGGPDLSGYGALAKDNAWLGAQAFGKDVQFNMNQALLFRFQNADKDVAACEPATLGLVYYNTAATTLVICNGKKWQVFAKVASAGTDASNPGLSCKDLADLGAADDGVYWLKPDNAAPAFKVYCDQKGGGWALALKTSDKSPWGYTNEVWTNTDVPGDAVPMPLDNADTVSRAFYKLAATQTRACILRHSGVGYACETVSHAAKTARNLANGAPLSSAQATNNLLTATWKSIPAGGVWGAYAWHRFGWHTGTNSHGGARFGFTADNDASDSQDAGIGFGLSQGAAPSIHAGAGYYHYPWTPQPNPPTAVLQGQIWIR
ncbi:MAG: hypothetical protein EXR79_01030 [Myxococcales bacterium]|nr:hypothetical protein [Myxococcales bacterium]